MKTIDQVRESIPRRERRLVQGQVSLRAATADGGPPKIGMHIPFAKRSEVLYDFVEIIDPGAFTKTLQERGCDVVSLWNHDASWVLGRESNDMLRIQVGTDGLDAEVELDAEDTMHRHFARRVERRDVIGSSFGFETKRDRWEKEEDGTIVRTLLEVKLYEVSPVTFPAYPDSEADRRALAEARSLDMAAAHGIDPVELVRVLAGVADGRVATQHVESVRRWIGKLQTLLPTDASPASPPLDLRRRRLALMEREHRLVAAS